MGYPEDRKRATLPDADEMPVSLQRQIDALKHDLDAATNTMTVISKAQRERIDGLEKCFDYGVGAYHNHERLKELEKKTQELDDSNHKLLNEIRELNGAACDAHTLALEVQGELSALRKRVEGLEKRLDNAGTWHSNLVKRVDGLEADRAAWAADAVKAGAHLRFQKLETRINEAFRRIGNTASDVTKLLEPIRKEIEELKKKVDACWAGQEEVTRRVANYTNALEMAVEAGDVLLEKKIDACRVAFHNTEKQLYEHALRLAGLDNLCKVHPKDPWKKRWDSLKAYVDDKKHEAAGRTVIWDALARVLQEMDALEKGVS